MDVATIVFSHGPGDRYRAGRTVRALRLAGYEAIDASQRQPSCLADILAGQQSAWLVRAGAWPVGAETYVPPPSATGLAVCALGVVRSRPGVASAEAAVWTSLCDDTGGDFTRARALGDRLPTPASVFLEGHAAAGLVQRLRSGTDVGAALAAEIGCGRHRVIHCPALDVYHDARMRVIQLVTSLHRGGAERIALNLTMELERHGVACRLVTLGQPTRATFAAPAGTVDLSARAGKREQRLALLALLACRYGADLIHAHLLEGTDIARVAQGGQPLIVTVHNTRPGWPAGLASLEVGDLLVGCSQAVEMELHDLGLPMPLRTAWNGVDFAPLQPTEHFRETGHTLRQRLGIAPQDVVLLALANPRPQKRLHLLPALLAATRAELARRAGNRDACLLLTGETVRLNAAAVQALEHARAEVVRLGLQERVHWTGALADVAPALAAADVLVSSSAHEGLSLAQVEGLAAGLPLVITDVGGAAELAHDNPAVALVPADCTAEQMAFVVVDRVLDALQQSAAGDFPGRCSAARSFSAARMAERYAWLYPRVLVPSSLARRANRGAGIWLITNNLSTGGAQSSARRLLLELAQENVPVRAAVLQECPEHPSPGRAALKAAGIPVLVLPRIGTVDTATSVRFLLEAIDQDPPHAVLLWNVIPECKVLLADALLHVPVYDVSPGEMYFTSLERYFARPRPGLPYLTAADYGRRLAGVIVKYHAEAPRAAELGAPVHVIPNGVPVDDTPRGVRNERLILGTAARLSPQKKLEELLQALRLAHGRLPPYVLRVAGGVETGAAAYVDELQRLAQGLSVEWVGELDDIRPFLRQLDFFTLVADPAGCPNASLEAMAAGLPVIITNVGGAAEQVEDGVTGRVVPSRDPQALAEALLQLAQDADRRAQFGNAGRERLRTRFSMVAMVKGYSRVCLEVRHSAKVHAPAAQTC